jgi:hypothetical protein
MLPVVCLYPEFRAHIEKESAMATQIEGQEEVSFQYISKKPTPVFIQTSNHRLHGDVHVGLGKRLKDELDGGLKFVPVTNVVVYGEDGEVLYRTHFLLINRDQLVWILPDEDLLSDENQFGG